jgi:hypothetical protein
MGLDLHNHQRKWQDAAQIIGQESFERMQGYSRLSLKV